MSPRMAEPALNSFVASALGDRLGGWIVSAEATQTLTKAGLRPDIVVNTGAAPIAIETEYYPGPQVEDDAISRIGKTLSSTGRVIEVAVAARLPIALGEIGAVEVPAALAARDDLEWCVWIEGTAAVRFPESGWFRGNINELAGFVETVAVSERRIAAAADAFQAGVSQAAVNLRSSLTTRGAQSALNKIATALHQDDSEQTTLMAVTVLANALVFQSALAGVHDTPSIEEMRSESGIFTVGAVLDAWREILKINYWPVFAIASQILRPTPEGPAQEMLAQLASVVAELSGAGATTVQDLAGQMFGRLIADRKFLATFYTLPASASLLAELAVSQLDARVDWGNLLAVGQLRVADFACGTGALLSAAYRRIASRVRRANLTDRTDTSKRLHAAFMEDILIGCDIMPAAVHLTASMLSAAHPATPFGDTNIHLMRYGYPDGDKSKPAFIGSLELLGDETAPSLFGTGRVRAGGKGDIEDTQSGSADFVIDDSTIDLAIQNPPFTRPNGPEAEKLGVPIPSFAGFDTDDDEQQAMTDRLKKLYARLPDAAGRGHAGLATNFVDLAHMKLRAGGVLALVLPATVVSGKSWEMTRRLLARAYEDIVIVTLATSGSSNRSFSADTGMAEALVIATKRESELPADGILDQEVSWISLSRCPENPAEAVSIARAVCNRRAMPSGFLRVGDSEIGCHIRAPLSEGGCAHAREPTVVAAASLLRSGILSLPRIGAIHAPLTRLGELGASGPHHGIFANKQVLTDKDGKRRRDEAGGLVYNGLCDVSRELVPGESVDYPSLWAHDAASGRESALEVLPDRDLRPWPAHVSRMRKYWGTATRLHYNRDFQLNSQSLAACVTPKPCIGGRAWPSFVAVKTDWELALALWANTTPGLIGHWWVGTRQQGGGGRASVSVGLIPELPALNCPVLTEQQLARLNALFADFRLREMLPANEAWRDGARQALDEAILCDVLSLHEASGIGRSEFLESLDVLRREWCQEPSVHGGQPTAPQIET